MKSKSKVIIVLSALFVIILIILLLPKNNEDLVQKNNPIALYEEYNYGETDKIIDIGMQPLWVPANIICEAIKRDLILKEELEKLGMELRFHNYLKGSDVNTYILNGELEAGIVGDMPALTIAAKTDVFIPILIQHGFTSIVANHHMEMIELQGKKIGYAFGSNAHYALLVALSGVGLSDNEVKLIQIDVNEMPEALYSGEIDAFSAWEPTPSIAVSKQYNNSFVIIHRTMSTGYMYFTNEFTEYYPDAVKLIIAAEIRALNWLQSDNKYLADAIEWIMQTGKVGFNVNIILTSEEYSVLAKQDIIGIEDLPIIPENFLEQGGKLYNQFIFLKSINIIQKETSWEQVFNRFDQDIILEIISNSIEYKIDTFNYTIDFNNYE